MNSTKKGLRLLSLSVFIQIVWGIVYVIAVCIAPQFKDGSWDRFLDWLPTITLALALVCHTLGLVGLQIADKHNKYYGVAWKVKCVTVTFTLFALIFACIASSVATKADPVYIQCLKTLIKAVDIVSPLIEVFVMYMIIKGCLEIVPNQKKFANHVFAYFTVETLFMITLESLAFVSYMKQATTEEALKGFYPVMIALTVIFAVFAIVFAVAFIRLIYMTSMNVKEINTKKK